MNTREDGTSSWEPVDPADRATVLLRLREALQALATVPDRRRAVKALAVTGFAYDEIGEIAFLKRMDSDDWCRPAVR